MAKHGIFSVGQFAELSKTTRDILHQYDRRGLLSPVMRAERNGRYYSSDQLATVNVIRMQLELGTPLAKIKRSKDRRTPGTTAEMLLRQMARIDAKIEELNRSRKLAETLRNAILSGSDIDERAIIVRHFPEEPIVLGDVNNYDNGRNGYDALYDFYADMRERHPEANLNYPVWARFSEERIRKRDWKLPDRYYFHNPDGRDRRPAALYAVGHARGGYGQTDGVYRRLLGYIGKNNLEICGDAYEEYPQNEVCVADDANYLIRVMVTVRKKSGHAPPEPV